MNGNRLLLKFERGKVMQLNAQIHNLQIENQKIKQDLNRKLAIYAGYLPNSLLNDSLRSDKSTNAKL
jgi:hypothetical protein